MPSTYNLIRSIQMQVKELEDRVIDAAHSGLPELIKMFSDAHSALQTETPTWNFVKYAIYHAKIVGDNPESYFLAIETAYAIHEFPHDWILWLWCEEGCPKIREMDEKWLDKWDREKDL